jgi:hypothetical protein
MILWEESCMPTVYVQNRIPHQILKNITHEESFTGVKPDIGNFGIFGCPVYFHVPKEKRSKLYPSGRKGTFVGYSESSKAYRIYIPGQRQIEVSRDVIFEEEIDFQRLRESHMEIDSESKPSPPSTVQRETTIIPVDPVVLVVLVSLVDIPKDIEVGHKRPSWDQKNLQEVEGHASPQGTSRERKRPKRFSSFFSSMSHIIDTEPSCHGEATG